MYTAEEQAEHRQQWVDALRSGRYEQAKGKLRDGDKFCCLGVACDISGLGEWDMQSLYITFIGEGHCIDNKRLPVAIQDWLGVESDSVFVNTKNGVASLARLNDKGITFVEIADIIENGNITM